VLGHNLLAAANTIVGKRMRAGGFREDRGTPLPPQDATTGDAPQTLAFWGEA
jgi:hypothetical protein